MTKFELEVKESVDKAIENLPNLDSDTRRAKTITKLVRMLWYMVEFEMISKEMYYYYKDKLTKIRNKLFS